MQDSELITESLRIKPFSKDLKAQSVKVVDCLWSQMHRRQKQVLNVIPSLLTTHSIFQSRLQNLRVIDKWQTAVYFMSCKKNPVT